MKKLSDYQVSSNEVMCELLKFGATSTLEEQTKYFKDFTEYFPVRAIKHCKFFTERK
jgi:hypothetical protein